MSDNLPLVPFDEREKLRAEGEAARKADPAARAKWEALTPIEQERVYARAYVVRQRLAEQIERNGPIPGEPIPNTNGRKKKPPTETPPDAMILPSPNDPMAVGRKLLGRYVHKGLLTLRHWRGGWWSWGRSHWVELEDRAVRTEGYTFTEKAGYLDPERGFVPWQPTRFKIGNLIEATSAIAYLDSMVDQPSWVGVDGPPVVAVANGLLRLDGRQLLPHSPSYWNQTAVPFDYDPDAPSPAAWLAFLDELWPDDPASIEALQEWFGYVISGRLNLHKILLIVGPTRGGKGTIARILGKLIGPANVAGPTLSSLSYDFGMAPLIGKPLAVVSDARLDEHRDSSIVVERLLAISGEDTVTVNRKYREQWTGKLPTRFLVISNELPKLGDQSGVIANRFVVLLLTNNWLGREDLTLEDRLSAELSGILNWALDGLERLAEQGRFTRPDSTDEALVTLQDLASPVSAFVRQQCVTGPGHEVPVEVLFKAWKAWAEDNGHGKGGNAQTFGRNLRSVVPRVQVARLGGRDDRVRVYLGIGFQVEPTVPGTADTADTERANTHQEASVSAVSADIPIVDGTQDDDPQGDSSTFWGQQPEALA